MASLTPAAMPALAYSRRLRAAAPTVLRFGVVGVSGVAVNCAVLFVLHGPVPLLAASVLATETAIVTGYVLNNCWTFRARRHPLGARRFLRYNAVALGGLGITVGCLAALVATTGLPLLAANLGAIGAATIWNFLMSALWTFR